jgi:hypothetical protein
MHITVQIEESVLSDLLAELLPITILLDEADGLHGRWIRVDRAQHLELGTNGVIRLVTGGEVHWPLGPVPLTLTAQRLVLLLRPVVVGTGAASRVLFRPTIESADVRRLPVLLHRGLTSLVNRALEARGDRLAWDLGRTLALRFVLPDTLVPLEAARVDVDTAQLQVVDGALALTVALAMQISRLADVRAPAATAA